MLYSEIIAVCSQIHTKHTVWAERRIVNVKLAVHIVTTEQSELNCISPSVTSASLVLRIYAEQNVSLCSALLVRHLHCEQVSEGPNM